MNKTIKTLLILSLSLILAGIAIFAAAFFINGRNFADINLSPIEVYEERVDKFYRAEFDNIDNIDISVTSRNVTIRPADDGVARIETRDSERDYLTTSFNGNTLHIKQIVNHKWYDFMSVPINFGNDIVIYLPNDVYDSLSIKSTSGGVDVTGNISFGKSSFDMTSGTLNLSDGFNSDETEIESTSGTVHVCGLNGTSLYIHSTSGSKKLENVIVSESLTVDSTSGEITLSNCDSRKINITSISGDVRCSLLTQKQFRANATSGKVSLPTISDDVNGTCEITATSGNITVTVNE